MLVGPSADAEVLTDRVPKMIPMIRSSPGGKGWELVYPRSLDGHVSAAGRTRSLRECAADPSSRSDGELAVFPLPAGAIGNIELGPLAVRFREIADSGTATVVAARAADETAQTAAGIAVVAAALVVIALLTPYPGTSTGAGVEIAAASPTPSATATELAAGSTPVAAASSTAVAIEATPAPVNTTAITNASATPTALVADATPAPTSTKLAAEATPSPTEKPFATPIERDPLALAIGTPKVRPKATPARTPKPSGFLTDPGTLDDEQKRFEDRLEAVPTMTPSRNALTLEGGEGGVDGRLGSGATGGSGGTVRDGGNGVVGRVDVSAAGSGDVKVASAGKVETPIEARMSTDVPTVTGTIDPEGVQSVVQEASGAFRQCYEAALRRNTRIAGKIVLSWKIVQDGGVEDVATGSSTLRDEEIERCLMTRVRALRFPRPDGGTVKVEYPMVLYPAVDPT